MITSTLSHFSQFLNPTNRLIMVVLVKNEEDIIEYNICFHARMGVDAFIVMDNNSTDNTLDILSSLKTKYELTVLHQRKNDYQQKKWMGQLVRKARKMGASWVIPNDADEFWLPRQGENLKQNLQLKDSTITLHRTNVLLNKPGFLPNRTFYKIIKTTKYTQEQELYDDNINIMFANISPKVIVNPNGFIKIAAGNHRATHIANFLTARHSSDIEVLHFPIRSWQHFENNVTHVMTMLSKDSTIRVGDHYKRWGRMLKKDTLINEFNKFRG